MSSSSVALDLDAEFGAGAESALAPARRPLPRDLAYRADVDGLRAVAVVLAVLFHLGAAGGVRGGFVGVDVFFVISGFLITRILLRAIGSGEFSLAWFYERRVRRILPALLAVVAACLVAGWFLLLPGDYRELGRSALWALVALANRFFLENTGYFDAEASTLPLLHVWSLAVEEQFYLAWPLFLVLAVKLSGGRKAGIAAAILLAVVASFVVNLREVDVAPKAAFFLLWSRAWELGMGGLVCLWPALPAGRAAGWAAQALPAAGLGAIAVAAASLTPDGPYPGTAALLPVLGAAAIVYDGGRRTGVARLLSLRPFVALGRISYSLYLWHWPLIVFWRRYTATAVVPPATAWGIAAASVVVAALSWRFIEEPGRRTGASRGVVFRRAVVAASSVALVAAGIVWTDGAVARIPERARGLGDLVEMWRWSCPETVTTGFLLPRSQSECVAGAPWQSSPVRALLWGDSFAEHVLPLFDVAGRDAGVSIALVTQCPAILDHVNVARDFPGLPWYSEQCGQVHAKAMQRLESGDVDLVILASAWTTLAPLLRHDPGDVLSPERGLTLIESSLDDLVGKLTAMGRRVVVFGDTPRLPIPDPSACAVAEISPLLRACPPEMDVVAWQNFRQRIEPVQAVLRAATERHPNAVFHSPGERLCADGRCLTELNGEFLYRDGGHLRRNTTEATRRLLAERLGLPELLRAESTLAQAP